jgi:5-methylcytosine-specific restriction endonuclease McrA
MTLIEDVDQEPPIETLLHDLQQRVDSVVSQAAAHAHVMRKHETHLSSRLAHAISDSINSHPIEVKGLKLEVHVEEFDPQQESQSGADLYISIVRRDFGVPTSKGMLVQSQRREALGRADERRRLRNQSARMRRRSENGVLTSGSSRKTAYPASLRQNHQIRLSAAPLTTLSQSVNS